MPQRREKKVCYSRGEITDDCPICPTDEENGTYVKFVPDKDIFLNYKYNDEFVETMMKTTRFSTPVSQSYTTVGAYIRATVWSTCCARI